MRRLALVRIRWAVSVLTLVVGLGLAASASGQTPPVAENPLHLEEHLEAATVEGSAVPADIPQPIEWRFDEPQPDWKAPAHRNPYIPPLQMTQTEDALRITLSEAHRDPRADRLHGDIYVPLPDLKRGEWGYVLVRARTSDDIRTLTIVFNLRDPMPGQQEGMFQFAGDNVPVIHDGSVQTYRLRADWPLQGGDGPWREVGLVVNAGEPGSIDILSVRLVPKEAPFAGAAVGVRTLGEADLRTLYIRAPGRVEYRVAVPDAGRLDVALGVLRDDAPVTFRVMVAPEGGQGETLLEESWTDPARWAPRSLDLSHLAGQTVTLTLAAEADRVGTVALWRAPTLYTPSRLSATIVDGATGEPTPVRVRLTDANGVNAPLPDAAIGVLYGPDDRASGYGFQRDSSFYVDGAFEVDLPPGTYQLSLSKGYEYLRQEQELSLEPGDEMSKTFRLERWINMPERGWFSADDHIHLRRSPRENPLILKWIAAEDIHVGALLQMGDFWTTYFAQYAWGRDGVYQVEDYFLTSGQEEPRTHELGHTISLAADAFVRFRGEYYYYDRVFDRVHELGGLTGYAHKGVGFHGYRGLTLDVLRNKVDFVEILQFGSIQLEHYYHFLDLGFKLTATAGSDFPYGAQIGEERFYTYVGDDFTFDSWRASIHAGHTFVSNGPIIDLTVNGVIPGDELDVTSGSTLSITARAFGHAEQVPLRNLEIVVHGKVLKRVTPEEPGQSTDQLVVEMELPVEHGVWIAAQAQAEPQQVAHTTPVYVTVDGSGFHNPETALRYLDLNEQYLDELEREIAQPNQTLDQHAWRYREGLEARIAETREIIAKLRAEFTAEFAARR